MSSIYKVTVLITNSGTVNLDSFLDLYHNWPVWIDVLITQDIHVILTSSANSKKNTIYYKICLQERAHVDWWHESTTENNAQFARYVHIETAAYAECFFYLFAQVQTAQQLWLKASMHGIQSSIHIFGGYKTVEQGRLKIHSFQNHKSSVSTSSIKLQGVVYDQGQVDYEGMIAIAENGSNSDATQVFKSLLLGSQARAFAKPALEVRTNQVKCGHGAAIGPIDPLQIHYLIMRGFSREQAHQLLVKNYIQAVYKTMPELLLKKAQVQLNAYF